MNGSYRVRREGFRHLAPGPVLSTTGNPARNDSGPDTLRCQVRSSGFRRLSVILMDGGIECNQKLQRPSCVERGRFRPGLAAATGRPRPGGSGFPLRHTMGVVQPAMSAGWRGTPVKIAVKGASWDLTTTS